MSTTEEKVRVQRVLLIDEAIRSGKFPNARRLAEKMEVTERTILRDIEYLRDMYHAPIEYDAAHRGFYYTEKNFFIKSVMLSEGELFSLALFGEVDPYHAICQKGNWYIIGFCHDRNEPRMFSLARIRNARISHSSFKIPADFNADAYFDKEIGVWASSREPFTVELLFESEIGTFALEQHWHDTQTVRQNEDGAVYVSFTTTQMPEVLRWVLGQGHTVKALNPPLLVEQVKAEAEKILKKY